MNTTIAWVVGVIVVLGAGWYLLMGMPDQQAAEQGAPEPNGQQFENIGDPEMLGTWKSSSDTKFTREFRSDGVIYDRYEGDATAGMGGSWAVVDPAQEAPLASLAASLAATTVIKATWNDGADVTYFSVNKLDEKSMTITDLSGRGGVTVFAKI